MPAIPARQLRYILFACLFFLCAQLLQQYVLRIGPMAGTASLHQKIVAGQHWLNQARLIAVFASVVIMLPAYLALCLAAYARRPLSATVAASGFLLFVCFEVGYRSVELLWVVQQLGAQYVLASAATQTELASHIALFDKVVAALYLPLLLAHLLGAIGLVLAMRGAIGMQLLYWAMLANAVRLVLRLFEFTPLAPLNVFAGPYYFIPVALVFGLLIVWAYKQLATAPRLGA